MIKIGIIPEYIGMWLTDGKNYYNLHNGICSDRHRISIPYKRLKEFTGNFHIKGKKISTPNQVISKSFCFLLGSKLYIKDDKHDRSFILIDFENSSIKRWDCKVLRDFLINEFETISWSEYKDEFILKHKI